jgi:hypothetical protein
MFYPCNEGLKGKDIHMKRIIVLVAFSALCVPANASASELLKDVSEIYLGIEFQGLPEAQVGKLKSKLEQNMRKAGLKVAGAGTLAEYEHWRETQLKIDPLRTPVVTVTCSVMTAKGGQHAYAITVHVEKMGFVETSEGPVVLSVEPSKQKFRAAMASSTLYPSELVIGINRDMNVVATEVENKFGEFLAAWEAGN